MARQTISASLDMDGELWEEYQEYSERFETNSEAVRQLIRNGLDASDADGGGDSSTPRFESLPSLPHRETFFGATLAGAVYGIGGLAALEWAGLAAVGYVILLVVAAAVRAAWDRAPVAGGPADG